MTRSFLRRLPAIARRDQLIDDLRGEVDSVPDVDRFRDAFVRRSSFQARLHAERRLRELAAEMGVPSTSVIRHGKLHVYELARSHGIDPPVEYGRWDDPADIPWHDLPDLVVVKSAFSSTSRGVFPLRRADGGWRVVTHDETMTDHELVASLSTLIDEGKAKPPFVAEEFLDEDGRGTRLPTDVKVYAFYGEVPLVLLRRPVRHGPGGPPTPFRIIDARGRDVTDFETRSPIDTSIPLPDTLDEVVDAASRLSVAIRAAFSRIDFYSIGGRVVFGEVTPRPGGNNWFGEAVDERLGAAWDRAQVRLTRDVTAGMSPEPEHGTFATDR